ncbi:hypothetical protein E8E13_002124 [Curvularia kusanoi]|uniref:Uncharacterized protein n=1 Tax=Curvularia kusanoi TaxID=90978 RepID=A0A9P4TBH9_CURKU|nr:hypothetical protein E8E13_002124 [Curvularia kusanoi]
MAPPGPPPYTLDQITAMSTKEERLRARAELNSYIARMKKEQQDRAAQSSGGRGSGEPTYNSAGSYAPRGRGFNPYRGGPQRGGYVHGGRGAASYHPYQRPPHPYGPNKFKNRTVVFNKPDISAEASGNESISVPGSAPLSNAQSRQNSESPSEPKQLCATFTSTGTPETIATHPCLSIYDYI